MSDGATLVTGAGGLVGRALGESMTTTALSRRPPEGGGLWWEPEANRVHDDGRPLRAVVHLAGEPIAAGRWTRARRSAIETSRIAGTRTLVEWLATREQRPDVLVSASAVGFYGDRGDEELREDSDRGDGFLADLCVSWEREARRAEDLGVRVVVLRLGVVLSRGAGVLAQLEPIFKLGAGGPVGSGRHWFPWVHRDDVVGALEWALATPRARGVYNLVAPGAVRQVDFARALGRALHRPAFVPTPAFALRLVFGELADELLLASQRARPARLQSDGYAFRWPDLDTTLSDLY